MVPSSTVRRFALLFLLWTVIGISFAAQFYISSSKAGNAVSWKQAVAWSLGDWYTFALLSIGVLGLARSFRLELPVWKTNLFIHAIASFCFSILYMVLRAWVGKIQSSWFGQAVTFREAFQPLLYKTWYFNILIYWVILAVASAIENYRRLRERELHAAELERNLVLAQLHALQMQLNPHFLFNTLHAISVLMHRDVDSADRMLIRLSELLRYTLESIKTPEVTLGQEISFLNRYLDIEKTRFGPRLEIETSIAPDTTDAMVPNLVLQPILENAIKHGIEKQSGHGRVKVESRREAEKLVLEVIDSGKGVQKSEGREGVGLKNTKSRLETLYGPDHTFELTSIEGGGTRVRITLPLKTNGM